MVSIGEGKRTRKGIGETKTATYVKRAHSTLTARITFLIKINLYEFQIVLSSNQQMIYRI